MQIRDVVHLTGLPAKTIRYYEQIGILPPAARAANNYRRYEPDVIERLRFIASARSLGFSLTDVAEILAARERGIAPCDRVLELLDMQLQQLDQRIANLLVLRDDLRAIRAEGAQRPRNDVAGDACVCYLVTHYRADGAVTISHAEVAR
jgi:DNA-binding transcriptional MerR regulator